MFLDLYEIKAVLVDVPGLLGTKALADFVRAHPGGRINVQAELCTCTDFIDL